MVYVYATRKGDRGRRTDLPGIRRGEWAYGDGALLPRSAARTVVRLLRRKGYTARMVTQLGVTVGDLGNGQTCARAGQGVQHPPLQRCADRLTPRQTRPFRSVDEYRAWREARKGEPARVSRAVRRLQYDGLVQPSGNPRLDPAERALFIRGGWERFRRFEPIERGGYIVGETVTEPESRERFRHNIVEALAQEPTGVPYRMLLEMTGGSTRKARESGTWRRAFADLVESGTVIPARARLPTLEGLEALRRRA